MVDESRKRRSAERYDAADALDGLDLPARSTMRPWMRAVALLLAIALAAPILISAFLTVYRAFD